MTLATRYFITIPEYISARLSAQNCLFLSKTTSFIIVDTLALAPPDPVMHRAWLTEAMVS